MPLVMNPAAIREELQGQHGKVARGLTIKAMRVTNGAKRRCPVNTGRLRSSIRWELGRDGKGLFGKVGTDVEYARYVHEGHKAFEVASTRGPGTALAFPVGGDMVFVSWPNSVTIPAKKGVPFLRDALQDIKGMPSNPVT